MTGPHSFLTAELTGAEARVLTGRPFSASDWMNLLQAGADARKLHDLLSRSDDLNIDSLNEAYEALSDAGHPYLEVLKEVIRLALVRGTLGPTVPVLSRICRVTPQPCQNQGVSVDSQVLSDLITALYLGPGRRQNLTEYRTVQRTLKNLTWDDHELTEPGRSALLASCAQVDLNLKALEKHDQEDQL